MVKQRNTRTTKTDHPAVVYGRYNSGRTERPFWGFDDRKRCLCPVSEILRRMFYEHRHQLIYAAYY